MGKTVLIVYAHQCPRSFNAAACSTAVQALKDRGCKVYISDLYAMNFKPTATAEDIKGDLKNPEHFDYGDETMAAWKEGRLSEDITAEQQKVKEADLIIFQFPLYWFNVPAILKGWIDRVFAQGFAFSLQNMYDNGIFKAKKAILSFTTEGMESMYLPDGINGDINVTLWPLQNGVLNFCGFQVLAPQIFWAVAHSPPEVRTAMLDSWRERLMDIWTEKPLTFASTNLFNLTFPGGFRLHPEAKEKLNALPYGITTAHHLGKPVPPNNQTKVSEK
ncbi:NAD(P)H dehydrogenase [quinone] 1 [Denticeps clupeoides]|uniref:Ribosyldihydronicotinamide dehydrogenase [quinone] n=1 Tax=Denticeps clupeoides TaxID=299321 RepID=A0AAY4DQ08_9TELE|nr:ribosyldihydronicotinamide dehydrogenase [quinone]-like [Denticeps clupeoides]